MNLSSVLIAISALGALMSIAMMASFSSLYDAILKKVSTISKYIYRIRNSLCASKQSQLADIYRSRDDYVQPLFIWK